MYSICSAAAHPRALKNIPGDQHFETRCARASSTFVKRLDCAHAQHHVGLHLRIAHKSASTRSAVVDAPAKSVLKSNPG